MTLARTLGMVVLVFALAMAGASPTLATHCDGTTVDEGTEPCPTPTPEPTPSPTPEPTPTPTPVPSPVEVVLSGEDRERLDDLGAAVTVTLLFVAFFGSTLIITTGLRR